MSFNTRRNNLDKGISFSDAPYIHYSPPRVLDAKRWARGGDVEKLQQAALFGQGHKLLGIAAPGTKARAFLRDLPNLISKCETLHKAVTSGSLPDLRNILDKDPLRKRLSLCRDRAGVGLLHKAVYYDFQDIIEYLVQYYPQTVLMRDSEGRTALHYVGTCSNPSQVMSLLIKAGADREAVDLKQKTPSYYMNRPPELRAHIPQPPPSTPSQNSDLVIKPSNIRIWCHDRDLGRLQQVVWKGQGGRLITEVSSQPAVKKFLEAVPHIMVNIRDIHTAAIENDLDKIKSLTQDPIPPIILSSQDVNGLTALHKAAGMGSYEVAKYIVTRFPESVAIIDNDGKTPLHWSALPKDERSFNVILQNGAEEGKLDSKMKSAGYYKNRPGEIDKSLLSIIPEAPRVASSSYPSSWDWNLLKVDEQNQTNTNTLPRPPKKVIQAVEKIVERVKTPPKPKPATPVREDTPIPVPAPYSPDLPDEDQLENDAESVHFKDHHEANNNDNLDNYNHEHESDKSAKESGNSTPLSQESFRPGTATINRIERYDTEENGLEIQDDEDYQEEIEMDDRTKTAVLNQNHQNIPSADHDDDDVQVRGENESDYGDSHNAETADVLDVEDMKRNQQRHGSEDVIEGLINADPEVDSMDAEQMENSDSNAIENMDDEEVQNLIDNGNMEQLAALVLNGEGERLVGQMSTNPELQAFLDNIPSYMGKIQRVHLAAKSGALREMQSALDRRKFATARDKISPGGATPLHVSVLFGRTSIVRYLATRFPETLSAVDFESRTPLHYAAVLKDNGHYFNMLIGLGANPKDQDENGRTAEEYLKNGDKYLNQRQLLKTFGAEDELLDEMLSDKVPNDTCSSRRNLEDPEILGILNRSFRLLQDSRRYSTTGNPPSASSNQGPPTTFLGRFLTKAIFEKIKLRTTRLDHNLFDVIWPAVKKLPDDKNIIDTVEEDFNGGAVAPDYYCYSLYEEFLHPLVKDLHCINMFSDLQRHPDSTFLPKPVRTDENADPNVQFAITHNLDPAKKNIISGTIECSRNMSDFELPLNLSVTQLESVERIVTNALLNQEFAKILYPDSGPNIKSGIYYTMNEIIENSSEIRAVLAASGLLIPLWNGKDGENDHHLHGKHWSYGRGVFLNTENSVAVYLNVQDHIRVLTCTSHAHPAEIGEAYTLMARIMTYFQKKFDFKRDPKLGYLSARPSFLGNSLHFTFTISLPNLNKDPDNLKHLCTVRGLNNRDTLHSEIVRVGNYQSLGITELQSFHDYTTAISNILQLERDMVMQNSMHVAEMFVNIFRRKKSNMIDVII